MADKSPSIRRRKISAGNTAWEAQEVNRGRRLSLENSQESDVRKRPSTSPGPIYARWQSEANYMAQLEEVCDEVS